MSMNLFRLAKSYIRQNINLIKNKTTLHVDDIHILHQNKQIKYAALEAFNLWSTFLVLASVIIAVSYTVMVLHELSIDNLPYPPKGTMYFIFINDLFPFIPKVGSSFFYFLIISFYFLMLYIILVQHINFGYSNILSDYVHAKKSRVYGVFIEHTFYWLILFFLFYRF